MSTEPSPRSPYLQQVQMPEISPSLHHELSSQLTALLFLGRDHASLPQGLGIICPLLFFSLTVCRLCHMCRIAYAMSSSAKSE